MLGKNEERTFMIDSICVYELFSIYSNGTADTYVQRCAYRAPYAHAIDYP